MQTARMFFGMPIGDAGASLAPLVPGMAEAAGGRAVPSTNLHATLAFVGAVAPPAIGLLRRIGASLPRQTVTVVLDTAGTFKGARVAWIGPSTLPPALSTLHAALSARLREARFDVEERPYHPHVTVARHCRRVVATYHITPITWRVRAIVLYESVTTPKGPRYEPQDTWPLDAA